MSTHRPRRSDYRSRRPRVERLEDRRVLATFVVDSVLDTGSGSLREAILLANADSTPDEIVFDSGVFSTPQTIELLFQLPTIRQPLSIIGPGAELLTLDAGGGQRHLRVDDFNPQSSIEVAISGLTLTRGNADRGGAIFNAENLTITGSTLSRNSATSRGGGVFNDGDLTITSSTLSGNSAAGSGGGIHNGGDLTITNSTLSGNSAAEDGGGILNGGDLTITNSTLSGNSAAGSGGGIHNIGDLTITNSTLSGNSAFLGGGIFNTSVAGQTLSLSGSIVANSIYGGDLGGRQLRTGSFNLIGDGQNLGGLTNTITGNPGLGPLADNGGPTLTHALPSLSPAVDAGDPAFDASTLDPPLLFDQRGAPFARVENGRIDLGAYESDPLPLLDLPDELVVSTTAIKVDTDFSPGELSLAEAILIANLAPDANKITFSSLFDIPQTIALTGQLPTIRQPLTIEGPGADLLALDAGVPFRHFLIDDFDPLLSIDVELAGLKLVGGFASFSGGAILNRESLVITNSTISGSFARSFGGGIYNSGTLTVVNSTISGNRAGRGNPDNDPVYVEGQYGGGVFNTGTLTVTGSTISGNYAYNSGSGVYSRTGTLTITSSTISGNSTTRANSAGIYILSGSLTLIGSIVADNSNNTNLRLGIDGNLIIDGSFNLIEEDQIPAGLTNTITGDPLLGPLQDNGGPTPTHALLPGSPAIDAGDPSPDLTGEPVAIPGQRLFNTGLNGAGELLGDREDDPHYEIISRPAGIPRRDATVSDAGSLPFGWAANDADSRWIGPAASNAIGPPGEYVYRTTFDLSDFDVSSLRFEITGSWQADDNGTDILINGVSTGQSVFLFDGLTDFSVDSGFVAGLNTLDFVVANGPGSTGLRVDDLQLTASLPPVDQRGLPRVANGRIDIGAFEVQPVNPTPGDYNGDLVVNAADFTAWRDTLGATGLTPLSGADGDGNGAVTANDYQVWRDNFGQQFMLPAVSLAAAASVVDPTGGRPGEAAASPPAGDAEPVAGGSVFAYAVAELDPGPRTTEPAARPSRRAPSLLVEEDALLLLARPGANAAGDHAGRRADAARDEAFSIEEEQQESDGGLAILLGDW